VSIRSMSGLALLFFCLAAHAETVHTRLFSLAVPDAWEVENGRPGLMLAGSSHKVGARPMPMLSVQYCTNDASPAAQGLTPCPASCEAGAATMVTELSRTMTLSPLWLSTGQAGEREYLMQGIATFGNYAAAFAFVCGDSGQAYVILAGENVARSGAQLEAVLQTLRWWPVARPSSH